MARSWYIAPSLVQLRNEVNARWPNRDKRSDGGIGDAAHSSRASDHNPNARGSVNAYDFDKDGIDPDALRALLTRDSRVQYVIYNRRIYSRTYGFSPRPYSGANPHTGHLHVSIRQAREAEQDTSPWGVAAKLSTSPGLPSSGANPAPAPTPTGGLSMSDINALMAEIRYVREQVKAVQQSAHDDRSYMQAQLRAIADLVGGRAALNARYADMVAATKTALQAQGVKGVDADKLATAIVDGVTAKMED